MQLAATILGMLAIAGLSYLAIATFAALRLLGRPCPSRIPDPAPAIAMLRPLHGEDVDLYKSLMSGLHQNYPGKVQHIFGVASESDPAIVVVKELQRTNSDVDIELVIDPRQHGSNRKISNLINMLNDARGDVLVLLDSDIGVPETYLRTLVAALKAPSAGAVSCLYRGRAVVPGPWARLSALGIDSQFLTNAALGIFFGLAKPCFGSTIALKRDVLVKAGGLQTVADKLADDYELGAAVRRQGLEVVFPPMLVDHNCVNTSWKSLLDHDLRWARTIRTVDPWGYLGSVVTFAVPHALLGMVISGFTLPMLGLFAATAAGRLCLFLILANRLQLARDRLWLLPIRDLLSYVVFIFSLFGNRVAWRGARFDVGNKGSMKGMPD